VGVPGARIKTTKDPRHLGRATALFACVAALAGGAAAVGPGSAAAHAGTNCGARTITVKAGGGKAVRVPASRIAVEGGATCADAYKVIRGKVTKRLPSGWTVSRGTYKVPRGLTPYVAVNGHKKVKFALVGS
jgi:hypothetical protein